MTFDLLDEMTALFWGDRRLRDGLLNPSARIVAWYVGEHVDDAGQLTVRSTRDLAAHLDLSDDTVRKALHTLMAQGWLTRTLAEPIGKSGHPGWTYTLHPTR